MPRKTLTAAQASRALGISLDTLRRWDREGKLRVERDAANRRVVPATEVERLRGRALELRGLAREAPPPRDFLRALAVPGRVSLIAEVKRRSPGAGPIRPDLRPGDLAREYEGAGAAGISVLTDGPYFGGALADLEEVRAAVALPVLRKDFTIAEEQIWEARAALMRNPPPTFISMGPKPSCWSAFMLALRA